jgi:hypothetical protein
MKLKLVLEGELEQDLRSLEEYVIFSVSDLGAMEQIAEQIKDQGINVEGVRFVWNPSPIGRLMVYRP